MKLRAISLTCAVLLAELCTLSAQTWTPIVNRAPFDASQEFLLTDGRVMVQDINNQNEWWALTPDIKGSYVNGTWSKLASSGADYGPLFYASAVQKDGRLTVLGGEYLFNVSAFTNLGAVYTPTTDTWKKLAGEKGLQQIGDASSAVLANGAWLVAACCDPVSGTDGAALATGTSLHWTSTGTGKADGYDEEGFTLLPNGKVLTVDLGISKNSELYDPTTGAWSSGGNTVVDFSNPNPCYEIGPAVLRPDGTVLQVGANTKNAVYNSITGVWSKAPTISGMASTDGPASILPNGNVLVAFAPYNAGNKFCYGQGVVFYEWNGTKFTKVPGPSNASKDPTFVERMLVLPTGEVMFTDYSAEVEFYTTKGTPNPAWAPTITKISSKKLKQDAAYTLTGTQLNGLTQGAGYGDDFQDATNYPLVRVTSNASGHVFYCRTYNHSSMGVATGSLAVTTHFETPANIELGASELVVVANGIPSAPIAVTVVP